MFKNHCILRCFLSFFANCLDLWGGLFCSFYMIMLFFLFSYKKEAPARHRHTGQGGLHELELAFEFAIISSTAMRALCPHHH